MTSSNQLKANIIKQVASRKNIIQDVSFRFIRHSVALQIGDTLTVQSKREEPVRVYFSQSDLDGACGLHVACMLLVILDLAKSDALRDMSRRKFGTPAIVFEAFRHTYFEGVTAEEYVSIFKTMNLPLDITLRTDKDVGKTNSLDAFAVDCLMRGELIAIAIESVKNRNTKHWTLGIGVEGTVLGRESIPDCLQLLDPSASAPHPFGIYNARLKVPNNGNASNGNKVAKQLKKKSGIQKPIHWNYESASWKTEPVRLIAAVRFRLRK